MEKDKRADLSMLALKELELAKTEVKYKEISLKENLEIINAILSVIKRLKKTRYCFKYLKKNWNNADYLEKELAEVEVRLKDYSNLYEKGILERKILKLKLKQVQREFTKKQKSFIKFEKKYFNVEV